MEPVRGALMVGAGGMARDWIRSFLRTFAARCHIAALVDVDSAALSEQGDFLGLHRARRLQSIDDAFSALDTGLLGHVDVCFVVVPPPVHREVIEAAAERGLDVLTEKPLAGTWADCVAVATAVRKHGIKLAVAQNYRHQPAVEAARQMLAEGRLGALNYISARFARDYRPRNSWGAPFRHEMAHALLIEGGIHHLDQIRNLSGANVEFVVAEEWRPDFAAASFDGQCCALVVGRLNSGGRFSYEGNAVSAGDQLSWGRERYRLECERGSMVIRADTVAISRHENEAVAREAVPVPVPTLRPHELLVGQFLDWIDGGPHPSSHLEDNLWTVAAMFAAIESTRTGCGVSVTELMHDVDER